MRKRVMGACGALAMGAALLGFGGAGCGGEQNVVVGTTEVKGTVGGLVLDAGSALAPLAGVSATVLAGGRSFAAMSASDGTWTVSGVPAGSLVVKLSASGHVDVYVPGELPTAAGNFPLANPSFTFGPIGLVPSSGGFKVRLVDDGGQPVAGVKVTARAKASYIDLSSGSPTSAGGVIANATSGSDGLAALQGLPDWIAVGAALDDGLTVSVPPQQITNATDAYSYPGGDYVYQARSSSTTPTIPLVGPRTALQVLSSNIDWLESGQTFATPSVVKVGGPIYVVFNRPIKPESVRAAFYDEVGALTAIQPSPAVASNVVTLSFGGKTLDPGTRYNLDLHASSLSDQPKEYNALAPFFTTPDGSPVSVSTTTSRFESSTSNDYIVVFSEPIGVGSGSRASLPCVVFYEADLDGAPAVSAGEWSSSGNGALKCVPGTPQAGFYLVPDEASFSGTSTASATTGFATHWRLTVRGPTSGYCGSGYGCSLSGVTVHLVFSRNPDVSLQVRRTTGAPVADMMFQLPVWM